MEQPFDSWHGSFEGKSASVAAEALRVHIYIYTYIIYDIQSEMSFGHFQDPNHTWNEFCGAGAK